MGFNPHAKTKKGPADYAMVAFRLRNTVTEHGHVARGVCTAGPDGRLASIVERTRIQTFGHAIRFSEDGGDAWTDIAPDTPVSMNMWGFTPSVFDALAEGFPTLHALKSEGVIAAVGAGIYAMELWQRVLVEVDLDAIILHNHHTLCDMRAFELLPPTDARGVGVINAAPFASGLLTGRPAPDWHPAPEEARALFAEAAAFCLEHGVELPRLALAFSSQEPRLPVTIFSCADRATLRRNLAWARESVDRLLVARVQELLRPVMNRQWAYGGTEPGSLAATP